RRSSGRPRPAPHGPGRRASRRGERRSPRPSCASWGRAPGTREKSGVLPLAGDGDTLPPGHRSRIRGTLPLSDRTGSAPPRRLAPVVGGLAGVFYGAALITGGWLGVPPHYGIRVIGEGDAAREVYPERGLPTENFEMLLGFGLAMVGGTLALIGSWRLAFVAV